MGDPLTLIDTDVHNTVPRIDALFPYMPDQWRDFCVEHGIAGLAPNYYPPGLPFSGRPEAREGDIEAGTSPELTQRHVIDSVNADYAILNCLYGVQTIRNIDWAVAMARAVNDWQADRWLAFDPRFKASIVVPLYPEKAAEEIERLGDDDRFVQVLLPGFSDVPLGKHSYWPIYEAAARHHLPVAIHPLIGGGNSLLPSGWPALYIEDYAAGSLAIQAQLASLLCDGVFQRYQDLVVVLLESGVTWLPSLMWRLDKDWKGLRREVPWVDRLPSEIMRDHVRLSTQPFDCAEDKGSVTRLLEEIGSVDLLLFSSDYPHWHSCDSRGLLMECLSVGEREQVLFRNAAGVYGL